MKCPLSKDEIADRMGWIAGRAALESSPATAQGEFDDPVAEIAALRDVLTFGVESIENCARAEAKGMTGCENLWKKYLTGNQIAFIEQASAALARKEEE